MSSLIVCNQGDAIHVVSDGAAYTPDGILIDIEQKVIGLPRQRAAIYTRGPSRMVWQAGLLMSLQFESFDDIVDGLEGFGRGLFEQQHDALNASGCPELEINIFGWSEQTQRTEAFLMRCASPGSWIEENAKQDSSKPMPFVVMKMTDFVASHNPTADIRRAAIYPNPSIAAVRPEIDLLHLFEIQRRQIPTSKRPDAPEFHDVGGYALLTTVMKDEVRQKVLARYDDRVGERIEPGVIDWHAWRGEHEPSFGSRVKRGIAERKERKRLRH